MPLRSSAPPGIALPSRPARPGLILAVLATASFIAGLDLYITNVGRAVLGAGHILHLEQPKTVADHILGFLNS
jgi:pimeloyl-ACP methyl ester carboxylesterase